MRVSFKMLDLLIRNGLVIDGTGNPGYYAALGIKDEFIHIFRGDLSSVESARVIDASNHVVCPGFIDMHAHSGLVILSDGKHEPKVSQGITTELIGVDGNSYAPFRNQKDLFDFIELNSGLDGNPNIKQKWATVEDYLDLFNQHVSINVAYILGNSVLRINSIGWDNIPANISDLENMKSIIRESMEEGAFGISTGLDYPPGSFADTNELITLSKQVQQLGGIYHTHVRYELGDKFLDPFREAIEIGRQSSVPVHITHFYQRSPRRGSGREMLELVENAVGKGLDVTFDSYPYIYGSTRLIAMFPDWAHEGGPENLKKIMRSEEGRQKMREGGPGMQEMLAVKGVGESEGSAPRGPSWQDIRLTYFKHTKNHIYEGKSVADVAAMVGKDPVDTMCDILLEEDLQTCYVSAGVNGNTLPAFVTHPLSMVGSDAVLLGDFPSPRTYGCFPVILAEYVREEKQMSLPNAIRKMTSFPAQRLGLPDRGILRDGMKADVTIFNPKTVAAPASLTEPKQFSTGIEYVLVNGVVVIDQGIHTNALPGRALKHGRSTT